MRILIIIFLLLTTNAYARDASKTLDTSGWTQEEKNMRIAVFYRKANELGYNIVPEIRGDQITFKNVPAGFDINDVVSKEIFDTERSEISIENAANEAAFEAARQAQRTAIKTKLNLTDDDLDDLLEALRISIEMEP